MNADNIELLKLAAKAAAIEGSYSPEDEWFPEGIYVTDEHDSDCDYVWNPLEDDGEALRLAVKLGIFLRKDFVVLLSSLMKDGIEHSAATRLAIVGIAAQIGGLQ